MKASELNRIRNTVNKMTANFVWCENYAHNELLTIFRMLDQFGLDWTCTEDEYFWIDGTPTTKRQIYRIEKDGETLETVLVVCRYYGADFNNCGHCELNCYLS